MNPIAAIANKIAHYIYDKPAPKMETVKAEEKHVKEIVEEEPTWFRDTDGREVFMTTKGMAPD